MRCALSIAGSDPIGGAGIQADIKAMSSLGIHPHAVITAVTAQNTSAVLSVMPVPCEMIISQMDAVFSDSDVRSVKTGMLYSAEIVNAVADRLDDRSAPWVADPVAVAGAGGSLAAKDLAKAVRQILIPACDLATPNRFEAEMITNMSIRNEDDAMLACELMGKSGTSIYLKGGHMESKKAVDILYHAAEFKRIEYPRLERAGHGGGCTLSAYITAYLAKGKDLVNSILDARELMQKSIASMYAIGKGDKVVDPMANIRMHIK